jgi:hypothetical protein
VSRYLCVFLATVVVSPVVRRCAPVALCVLFLLGAPHVSTAQTSVTTNRNDLARTGANLSEATLNTSNVNVTQFGKLFERSVDDEVYAQPLYVSDVNIPGVGLRNVLYVVTMSNSVYAFDADNPAATAPLWRVSFINPPQIVPVRRTDVGQTCGTYLDFANNIGIVGTPVIDPVAQTIYSSCVRKRAACSVSVCTRLIFATGIRDRTVRR